MGLFGTNIKKCTDEELLQLIARGNTLACDELYTRYSSRLLKFLYRLLNNDKEKAQDFLQDLFVKIIEKPERFDTSRKFSTWVYTIAANMCKNEHRNMGTRGRLLKENHEELFPSYQEEWLENVDKQIFRKKLAIALDDLDYLPRETFILRYQEELSIKEISQILDCSEGTVKSRLFYTLRKLAKSLKSFQPSM